MEWVETTGRSVQEAKEAALDELGVDEADAEFEVIAEAQLGLFGRLRSEARVRARVKPTAPRAKEDRRDRRDRRRRSGSAAGDAGAAGPDEAGSDVAVPAGGVPTRAAGSGRAGGPADREEGADRVAAGEGGRSPEPAAATAAQGGAETAAAGEPAAGGAEASGGTAGGAGSGPRRRKRNRQRGGSRPGGGGPSEDRLADLEEAGGETDEIDEEETGKGPHVEVALDEQAEVAADFLKKLVAEFGLQATVSVAHPDEDTVELQLTGPDLGILIGPKGATLIAIQSLTRTVVFNETGGSNGHINVDVGGYRQKRTEALIRFSTQIANQVKETGTRTVLEPMSSVDRKVVHDTIAAIDGVSTVSEGEEPRRRVVVLPD